MNYTTIAEQAEQQLSEAGMDMTLQVTTAGTYDPSTDTETGGSTANHSCVGIMSAYKAFHVDGTIIQHGDMKAILGASTLEVEPSPGDTLLVGSVSWSVVNVETVAPAGVAVLYKCQVRRS